jgi:hypothetical protein
MWLLSHHFSLTRSSNFVLYYPYHLILRSRTSVRVLGDQGPRTYCPLLFWISNHWPPAFGASFQSGALPCVLLFSTLRQQDPLFVRFSYLQDRFKRCRQSFKALVCRSIRSISPLILPSLCPVDFLNCMASSSNLLISSACPLTFSIYNFITVRPCLF